MVSPSHGQIRHESIGLLCVTLWRPGHMCHGCVCVSLLAGLSGQASLQPASYRYASLLSLRFSPVSTLVSCLYACLLSLHFSPVSTLVSCLYASLLSLRLSPVSTLLSCLHASLSCLHASLSCLHARRPVLHASLVGPGIAWRREASRLPADTDSRRPPRGIPGRVRAS